MNLVKTTAEVDRNDLVQQSRPAMNRTTSPGIISADGTMSNLNNSNI